MSLVTELRVPALPDYVGIVRLTISGILARMNFSAEEVEDVKVAVSEACTNAVQYAYQKSQKTNFIYIKVTQKPKAVEIIIEDNGTGFNPEKPIKQKIKDDDIHMGLGIVFMKNLMDELTISSKKNVGTKVTMVKYLKN
jgi:serine/threonine-protein kinase RsbW